MTDVPFSKLGLRDELLEAIHDLAPRICGSLHGVDLGKRHQSDPSIKKKDTAGRLTHTRVGEEAKKSPGASNAIASREAAICARATQPSADVNDWFISG